MVSCCNRRLYKGNSYEICLPITDSGVTSVKFYTTGDVVVEKEGEIVDDTMCFELAKDELDLLPDGVLRYSYDGFDSSAGYVVVTPRNYSASTLDDLLEDAFDSGYTAGQEDCSGSSCNLQSNKTVRLSEIPLIYSEDAGYYSISGNSFNVYPREEKDGMERVQIFGNFRPDEAISHGYNIGFSAGTDDVRGRMQSLGIGRNDLTFQEFPETPSVPYRCHLRGSFSAISGYSSVFANIEVTDLYSSAYTSGYTDGFQPGYDSGYMAGRNDQKSYIIPGDFSANGTYTNPDGWSPIHINVPQSGHTDQEMQDSWDSGYTSGYTAGQESCSGSSCNLQASKTVYLGGFEWSYDPGDGWRTPRYMISGSPVHISADTGYDGLEEIQLTGYFHPTEAYDDGYGKGYTSGYTDGLNACTGYTQEDLDAAFASGWSAGYDSGLTDCSGDTPSAATAITISVPQNLKPGDTGSTSVSTSPQDAPTNLSYSSSDNSVATVDNNGNITAIGTGTTNICVTDSISQITECTQLIITEPEPVYSGIALTFDVISGGSIVWTANRSSYTPTIQYSKNGGSSWTNITASTGGTSISVNAGDKVLFRGNNPSYKVDDYEYAHFYHTTAVFNLEGNIMSLVNSTGYSTATTVSEYAFYKLFWHCDGLKSAENLVLPATTLATGCYQGMFSLCRGLTKAPKLQATAIAANCYRDMFSNCSNLAIAPELPATTLAEGCYWCMFSACTSLTAAPELNALTFKNYCYECMFNGCTNLNYIKCLGYGELNAVVNATNNWVKGVATYGTFVKHPNMDIGQVIPPGTYWLRGDGGIPTYWTVEDADIS